MRDRKEYDRAYYAANSDKIRARALRRHAANREAHNASMRDAAQRLKVEVFEAYGGCRCVLCPEARIGALTIDHLNGGGKKHRAELGGGSVLYRTLKRGGFPAGYRVLCSNCNWLTFLSKNGPGQSATSRRRQALKVKFMAMLGGRCAVCSIDDIRLLTAHHLDNDGARHRRELGVVGGWKFYRAILQSGETAGLECRCFSCNDCEHAGAYNG